MWRQNGCKEEVRYDNVRVMYTGQRMKDRSGSLNGGATKTVCYIRRKQLTILNKVMQMHFKVYFTFKDGSVKVSV